MGKEILEARLLFFILLYKSLRSDVSYRKKTLEKARV